MMSSLAVYDVMLTVLVVSLYLHCGGGGRCVRCVVLLVLVMCCDHRAGSDCQYCHATTTTTTGRDQQG